MPGGNGDGKEPVTETLCQERLQHVRAIEGNVKAIDDKLDGIHDTLTELSSETRSHFASHEKSWNKGYAVIMGLIALAAMVIALISLAMVNRNHSQQVPAKVAQMETKSVQFQKGYSIKSG